MQSLVDHRFLVTGRLRPDVTPEQATADLALISGHVRAAHRDIPLIGKSAMVRPLLEDVEENARQTLNVLSAATSCMLVARGAEQRACDRHGARWRPPALDARAADREPARVRGRRRSPTGAGVWLRWSGSRKRDGDISRVESIQIDGPEVLFAAGLIVLSALPAGGFGSVAQRDERLLARLQESGRGTSMAHGRVRLLKVLLTLEVGLTVALLVGAGLLLKSYERLRSWEMGRTTREVLTMRIALFGGRLRDSSERVNFFSDLLRRVRTLPGVDAAGIVQPVPGQGDPGRGAVHDCRASSVRCGEDRGGSRSLGRIRVFCRDGYPHGARARLQCRQAA